MTYSSLKKNLCDISICIFQEFKPQKLDMLKVNNHIYLLSLKSFLGKDWPRWWYRRLLNSPLPTNTQNIQQLSLKIPETSWMTPTHQVNEKIPTLKQTGKAEPHSHCKTHPCQSAIQSRGNSQILASSWGIKGLDPTFNAPTFKTLI